MISSVINYSGTEKIILNLFKITNPGKLKKAHYRRINWNVVSHNRYSLTPRIGSDNRYFFSRSKQKKKMYIMRVPTHVIISNRTNTVGVRDT